MARAGADAQAVFGAVMDSVESRNAPQADHHPGHEQALAHHDQQRRAARDDAGVVAVLFHQAEGFFEGCRFLIVEADHRWFFSLRARRIFSGVIGKVLTRTPTASKIALLRTAAVGSMLSSPNPLAPNGPVGS